MALVGGLARALGYPHRSGSGFGAHGLYFEKFTKRPDDVGRALYLAIDSRGQAWRIADGDASRTPVKVERPRR